MTSSKNLESRGEIEAAKRLLALARRWSHTAKSLASGAEVMCEVPSGLEVLVRGQLREAEREVEEAKEYLAEVERRWEVIGVDDADSKPARISPSSASTTGARNVPATVSMYRAVTTA